MTLHESSRKGDYLSPYSPTNPLKLESNSDLTLSLQRVASSIQFQRSFSISFPVSVWSSKRQNAEFRISDNGKNYLVLKRFGISVSLFFPFLYQQLSIGRGTIGRGTMSFLFFSWRIICCVGWFSQIHTFSFVPLGYPYRSMSSYLYLNAWFCFVTLENKILSSVNFKPAIFPHILILLHAH